MVSSCIRQYDLAPLTLKLYVPLRTTGRPPLICSTQVTPILQSHLRPIAGHNRLSQHVCQHKAQAQYYKRQLHLQEPIPQPISISRFHSFSFVLLFNVYQYPKPYVKTHTALLHSWFCYFEGWTVVRYSAVNTLSQPISCRYLSSPSWMNTENLPKSNSVREYLG